MGRKGIREQSEDRVWGRLPAGAGFGSQTTTVRLGVCRVLRDFYDKPTSVDCRLLPPSDPPHFLRSLERRVMEARPHPSRAGALALSHSPRASKPLCFLGNCLGTALRFLWPFCPGGLQRMLHSAMV